MQQIRRSATSLRSGYGSLSKSQNGLFSILERNSLGTVSSSMATEAAVISNWPRRVSIAFKSGCMRQPTADANHLTKEILQANGIPVSYKGHFNRDLFFVRSFASKASKQEGQTPSESKGEVSTVEDPFDSPTYHIPDKPVTFAEGASYSLIILAGLGVAAAAAYAVFKELIFEPKEYKIFNKALKRIQDDSQVRVRIGSPITGYGQESRNRAARQRIPHKIYTDEDGVEHVQINFYIRGPNGAGKVAAEMFKDKVDKQWKYTYLIVQFMQPSQTQLILESYIPALGPVTA